MRKEACSAFCARTVSYTHLDVYKRQALYRGEKPDASEIAYKDYAYWRTQQGEAADAVKSYWEAELQDAPAGLELPLDRPKPKERDCAGKVASLKLERGLSDACERYCDDAGITAYMLFVGVYGLLPVSYTHLPVAPVIPAAPCTPWGP